MLCLPCWSPCYDCHSWESQVFLKKVKPGEPGIPFTGQSDSVLDGFHVPAGIYRESRNAPGKPHLFEKVVPVKKEGNSALGQSRMLETVVPQKSQSGGLFWGDSRAVVWYKACMATISMGVVLYTLVAFIGNGVLLGVNFVDQGVRFFEEREVVLKEGGSVATLAKRRLKGAACVVGEGLFDLARVPFYGVALQVAVLFTLISPYNGRRVVSKIERAWHKRDPSNTARKDPKVEKGVLSWREGLEDINSISFYLFYCFQPSRVEESYVPLSVSRT